MQKGFLDSGGRHGNHKKKDSDKVGIESSTRPVELMVSSLDGTIWVKLYDIPIVSFTADGLSAMDTKLGNPIMLDSYTSSICLQSWGHMDYARALINIRANRKLKDEMTILNMEDDE
ncbi:hypothetical protein Tco_1556674 [Tanacetum coccineum]